MKSAASYTTRSEKMHQLEFQFPEKNKKPESVYEWLCSIIPLLKFPASYYMVPDGRYGYKKVYREGN